MRTLDQAVASLFEPSDTTRRTGVELEMLVYPAGDFSRTVTIAESEAALAVDPGLLDEARISFEPGGQVELSPAPDTSVERLVSRVQDLAARVSAALALSGIQIHLAGTDPWRSNRAVGLQKRSERYLNMQRHFDSIGPAGRRMMRQTASLQVCVSLLPGASGREQWLLANLMAPVLQATFANSPGLEGRVTGLASTRSAVLQLIDPSRTGFAGRHYLGDPVEAYLEFASHATPIPLSHTLDPSGHHLSTLFPPVRPRGNYLEMRCLDALPMSVMPQAVRLVTVLLHDDRVRGEALEAMRHRPLNVPAAWRNAARLGLGDSELRSRSEILFRIAAENPQAVAV